MDYDMEDEQAPQKSLSGDRVLSPEENEHNYKKLAMSGRYNSEFLKVLNIL